MIHVMIIYTCTLAAASMLICRAIPTREAASAFGGQMLLYA